ncbi:kinase-like protein [Neolentinus lepideus HHB14362 ss-1]|uniref:Kinase-like protein n=1 Tax=Neolentinus lepideus HHB14362 ss-1 TaxID=1314782 RepID=A0A165V3K6_9AGAM|nr:kinase-like protein [Neolentinus lepideus HHB14362 ss-1]
MLERIAGALHYLHSHDPPLVHRDIKGANIVVKNGEPQLTDFGLTTFSNSFTVSAERAGDGTYQFQAPETFPPAPRPSDLNGETNQEQEASTEEAEDEMEVTVVFDERRRLLAPPCDMYSFACLCFQVYALTMPWKNEEQVSVAYKVTHGRRPPRPAGNVIPDPVWSLMQECWPQEPQRRLTSGAAQDKLRDMLNP